LANQIRRAAVSLINNIAEGHGRFHFLDQIKFMLTARGSLKELLDDLNVCEDEMYLTLSEIEILKQEGWRVHKLINGYIRFLRKQSEDSRSPRIQESPEDAEVSETEINEVVLDRFIALTLQR
jgi:four helix bundle protein